MTQQQLNRMVSDLTGETRSLIRSMGFQEYEVPEPAEPLFRPEEERIDVPGLSTGHDWLDDAQDAKLALS